MTELSPISQYLCDAIDSLANHVNTLAEDVESACEVIVQTLLSDHKLIVCGNGYSAPPAALFTTCLMHQQEFERPSLPALNISIDSTSISAIAKDGNYHNVYAKQIRALAQEGDTLVALSIDGNCSNIVQAIQIAHEKGMRVITITGSTEGKMSAVMHQDDVEVSIENRQVSRTMEAQLFAINAICHQVESQLFGVMF